MRLFLTPYWHVPGLPGWPPRAGHAGLPVRLQVLSLLEGAGAPALAGEEREGGGGQVSGNLLLCCDVKFCTYTCTVLW